MAPPYRSIWQRTYFHGHREELEDQGVKVLEWDKSSERHKYCNWCGKDCTFLGPYKEGEKSKIGWTFSKLKQIICLDCKSKEK